MLIVGGQRVVRMMSEGLKDKKKIKEVALHIVMIVLGPIQTLFVAEDFHNQGKCGTKFFLSTCSPK